MRLLFASVILLLSGCDAMAEHDCRVWASRLDNYEQCAASPACKLSPDDFRIKKQIEANMVMEECEKHQPNGGGAR